VKYIGIDPGLTGAWAIIDDESRVVRYGNMDDAFMLQTAISDAGGNYFAKAGLEKVHSMPKQGVVSVFTFGENYGWWKGFLEAVGIGYALYTPQAWQKGVLDFVPAGIPKRPGETAAESVKRTAANRQALKSGIAEFVIRRFPEMKEILSKKKNWGIADALCIALYTKKSDI